MRRFVPWLLSLLVLLTGCVSVPTAGPVERHTPKQQQVNPGVEIEAVPPAPGAAPSLIVEGFLHAMATYQPNYRVARQYLTTVADASWNPASGVVVYADGYPPIVGDQGAQLSGPLIGRLDGVGAFRPDPGPFRHDFGLVQDAAGQWRISNAPQGLLISQYLFATTYVRTELRFWDRTRSWLVPDPRYFPKGQPALVDAVRAVIQGPSLWLAPALRDPSGNMVELQELNVGATGVVNVRLGDAANRLNWDQRNHLLTELVWSLAGSEGVTGVRVAAGGEVWQPGSSVDGVLTSADYAERAPVATVRAATVFVVSQGSAAAVLDTSQGPELTPVAPGLARIDSLAVRADASQLAAVTHGRTRLRTVGLGGGTSRLELSGTQLLRPQYSRFDELWVGTAAPGRAPFTVRLDGKTIPVATTGLPAGTVRAFRLSPDGVRMVVVVGQGPRTWVGLARIVRLGERISVEGWQSVGPLGAAQNSTEILDAAWDSASTLMLLSSSGGSTRVVSTDQDGAATRDVGPSDAADLTQLAMNPGVPGLILGSDGRLYRFYGEFNWGLMMAGVQAVAYPG
ncbi:MAG: LpqB family beta-propeller domain-containing protein [Micropruina sp.]